MRQEKIPEEWRTGLIVPVWKRKGDVHDRGKYRGIVLLSHVLKVLERILDGRIKRQRSTKTIYSSREQNAKHQDWYVKQRGNIVINDNLKTATTFNNNFATQFTQENLDS